MVWYGVVRPVSVPDCPARRLVKVRTEHGSGVVMLPLMMNRCAGYRLLATVMSALALPKSLSWSKPPSEVACTLVDHASTQYSYDST
jgi:hypothetical protein